MTRRGLFLVVFTLVACSNGGAGGGAPPAPTSIPAETTSIVTEYRPGTEARVLVPSGDDRAAVVVMIPGGAWQTADPAGLDDLARHLAGAGMVAAPVEIRAGEDGVVYPVPVDDVLCALATAADTASGHGLIPDPLIVLGHSSGAHLAALAALDPTPSDPDCPHPGVAPDALVGMAGTYDVRDLPDLAMALFGVAQGRAPETWAAGNPVLRAASRPDLPVLLIHGEGDDLVPLSFTTDFARALEAGGHQVTVETVRGADHHAIYTPAASGDLIVEWVEGLDE